MREISSECHFGFAVVSSRAIRNSLDFFKLLPASLCLPIAAYSERGNLGVEEFSEEFSSPGFLGSMSTRIH